MLNKLKIGAIIGLILTIVRQFLPDLVIPEGFADAIVLVIVFASQFFVKESPATVAALVLK